MKEKIINRLLDEGYKEVFGIHPLKGSIPTTSGDVFDVFLVRTPRHLLLKSGSQQDFVLLLDEGGFSYRTRVLEDQILIQAANQNQVTSVDGPSTSDAKAKSKLEVLLRIPTGEAENVQKSIALFRLQRRHGQLPSLLDVEISEHNRLIETLLPLEAEVAVCVAGHAPLLVWLECFVKPEKNKTLIKDVMADSTSLISRFWATPNAHGFVHFSNLGDVEVERLAGSLQVKSEIGRDRARCGGRMFLTGSQNEQVFHDVSKWISFSAADQLAFSVGESLRMDEKRTLGALQKQRLLFAAQQGSAIARIAQFAFGNDVSDEEILIAFAAFMEKEHLADENLLGVGEPEQERIDAKKDVRHSALLHEVETFFFTSDEKVVILEQGRACWEAIRDDAPYSIALAKVFLPLHQGLHQAFSDEGNPLEQVGFDLALAEHLLSVEHFEDVIVLLEARLHKLPTQEIADLLVAAGVDGTEGPLAFRVCLLELLEIARGRGGPHTNTRREICALIPLSTQRLRALLDVVPPTKSLLRTRIENVLLLLQKGGVEQLNPHDDHEQKGEKSNTKETHVKSQNPNEFRGVDLDEGENDLGSRGFQPLEPDVLEAFVRHPASREGHPLGFMQSFLAEQKVPDSSALKAYCERLSISRTTHNHAKEALALASVVLGVPAVEGYISRGDKSVGLFAYEGSPSFVLLGGRHLDDDDPLCLSKEELLFEIGAEVAHLRFQHTRVTSKDIWDGAWNKGKASIGFVLGMLPVFRGLKPVDKLADLIELARKSTVGRVVTGVGITDQAIKKAGLKGQAELEMEGNVGTAASELLATHRVMQLSADRAGLLLCQEILPAVRSLFLEAADTAPELEVAKLIGLAECLARETTGDTLTIRISALIAFYLSTDWDQAVDALCARSVDEKDDLALSNAIGSAKN
ncbi:MAG: hypothetical protein GY822_26520 [Deltaproteobacteria bacterium]|nr:hypothetical protein [Deltaproteobacteria bacterium]